MSLPVKFDLRQERLAQYNLVNSLVDKATVVIVSSRNNSASKKNREQHSWSTW